MTIDRGQKSSFVFTLAEDEPIAKSVSTLAVAAPENDVPEWARTLEQLRQHKKHQPNSAASAESTRQQAQHNAATFGINNQSRRLTTHANKYAEQQKLNKQAVYAADQKAVVKPATMVLDPIQREHVYRAYLRQWQQQINQEAQQKEAVLNDNLVLLQEDWLAAQTCLQTAPADANIACTIRLQKHKPAQVVSTGAGLTEPVTDGSISIEQSVVEHQPGSDNSQPLVHVHLHVIEPRGRAERTVTCLSEQMLLQQLTEKLRPHLADVLAGMVRVAVQRHTAGMISALQKELLAEVPTAVDDVLRHHLTKIMKNIKQNQHEV